MAGIIAASASRGPSSTRGRYTGGTVSVALSLPREGMPLASERATSAHHEELALQVGDGGTHLLILEHRRPIGRQAIEDQVGRDPLAVIGDPLWGEEAGDRQAQTTRWHPVDVGEFEHLLREPLAEGGLSEQAGSAVVLEGAGEDLGS